MVIGEICSRDVIVAGREEALAAAARRLLDYDVGALVVIEQRGSARTPVGIVTDRDLVCGQLERRSDLHCLTTGDVMTSAPLVLEQTLGIEDGIARLASRGVRRAPVVDAEGALVGIVSLDDLLSAVADELDGLARLIGSQAGGAHRARNAG